MPTYDYVCEACGHEFEEFQAMSAKVLRTCPKCGKKKLLRRIGAGAGLIFKGTGFYQTDYKSTSRSEPSKEKTGSDTEKGTEGKPKPAEGGSSPSGSGSSPSGSEGKSAAKKKKD
jgi:putative FmdB family regulatory protein